MEMLRWYPTQGYRDLQLWLCGDEGHAELISIACCECRVLLHLYMYIYMFRKACFNRDFKGSDRLECSLRVRVGFVMDIA